VSAVLTPEEAAALYARCLHILDNFEDDEKERADTAAIPRSIMVYCDAINIVSGLVLTLHQLHPELQDDTTLEALLRSFATNSAFGRVN
jgi:hypothetical protein